MMPFLRRALVGTLTILAIAGCETQRAVGIGMDDQDPNVRITLVGGVDPDAVNISGGLEVRLNASDNLSLRAVGLAVISPTGTRMAFETRFTAATPSYENTIMVTFPEAISGETVTLVGIAEDGAGNTALDTLTIRLIDPTAPVVTITAPVTGAVLRSGAGFTVDVTAVDDGGIASIGYEILRISASGLETIYHTSSVTIATVGTSVTRSFAATVPDTLTAGAYSVRGFALDNTGNRGVSIPVSVNIQDTEKPGLNLISPPQDTSITIGSELIAVAHLTDNTGIARYSIVGISTSGDPNLGVVDTIIRYDSVFAPVNVSGQPASFPPGVRDTIVQRLMRPRIENDQSTLPVFFVARVTDLAGNDSVVVRRVQMVSGPLITTLRPGENAIASPGLSIIVELRADDVDGVRTLGYTAVGSNFSITRQAPAPSELTASLTFTDTLLVPADAIAGTTFLISPYAVDNLGFPGAGRGREVSIVAPGADFSPPLVFQTLPDRIEAHDSVLVRAIDPSGIAWMGFEVRLEATGAFIKSDSVAVGGTLTDQQQSLALAIPTEFVGQKIIVISFAVDAAGNRGWSIPSDGTIPGSDATLAKRDTALVVFGRTFRLPAGGLGADIAVDTLRGFAYLANLERDRLEVWRNDISGFAPKFIAVGSQPWGMMIDNSSDTLLVANSGGTNISRVFIGSSDLAQVNEVASRRIKTPNSAIYEVTERIEQGIVRFKVEVYDFSDRPQFIAQGATGRIYYSTKPTSEAEAGTIRYLDPNQANPDVRIISNYIRPSATTNFVLVNADLVAVTPGTAGISDQLSICDHQTGTFQPTVCGQGFTFNDAWANLNAQITHDIVLHTNSDVSSLALTDTTFVAVGGDRRWVAFGEGATDGAGRVMLADDVAAFFSSGIDVVDLTNNAAESVFGIAINSNSTMLGSRGAAAYFSDIEHPFHLRLQGKYATNQVGAGIAFHPNNTGGSSGPNDPTRVAFVASADGTIEIVDSFHYTSRGKLPVRANLYGPIRVTNRFATDDPDVILKLFGLTAEGMIVIDIRATDIKPLP
jgi:hypothetical protein